jgi:hypothetical protein
MCADGVAGLLQCGFGGRDVPERIQEAEIVDSSLVANCGHADPGLLELSSIGFALIS